MNKDRFYMKEALSLAERGRGKVYPNPLVGAIVVKKGRIVGKGFHAYYGGPHAEMIALRCAGCRAKGATLYVTLEPCSTYGKTPPCTLAILKSGLKRVVIATLDPNPVNRGKGRAFLVKNGISVKVGIEKDAARCQNASFFKYQTLGLPFVQLKLAQSLDGKIASYAGDSKWISSTNSRRLVHKLRAQSQAVLVGYRTALIDNPCLNIRDYKRTNGYQPLRVVLDPWLKLPLSLNVFNVRRQSTVVIASLRNRHSAKWKQLERRGVKLVGVTSDSRVFNIKEAMARLADMGVINILVEGGGETAASFLEKRLVDKVCFFIAPKIIGGRLAKTSIEGNGVKEIRKAVTVKDVSVKTIGKDILVEGTPNYS